MPFRSLRPLCLHRDYYYRYRNYIPEWGQFASPDMMLDATEPEGACNYLFCGNDPVGKTDPMGLWTVPERKRDERWARVRAEEDDKSIYTLALKLGLRPSEAFGINGWLRHVNGNPVEGQNEIRAGYAYLVPNTVALYTSISFFGDGTIAFVTHLRRTARQEADYAEAAGFYVICRDGVASEEMFKNLWKEDGIYAFIFGGHGNRYGLKASPGDTTVTARSVSPPYRLSSVHLYACYSADEGTVWDSPTAGANAGTLV